VERVALDGLDEIGIDESCVVDGDIPTSIRPISFGDVD
jgi:hypothetical protein